MAKKEVSIKKSTLIALAVVFSFILFFAGLISGLSYSKLIEARVEQKAQEETGFLVDYIDSLDNQVQSAQLQERFISSLQGQDSCKFTDLYFSQINPELSKYWSLLPTRLEEYESNNPTTDQYLNLKKEYTKVSLRAWIDANSNYQKCNSTIIPVLYFYSKNCPECIKQGEQLDSLKEVLANQSKTLVVFTVDFEYNEPTLNLIKNYYDVSVVPAIIVNDQTLQGRLFTGNEILIKLKPQTFIIGTHK